MAYWQSKGGSHDDAGEAKAGEKETTRLEAFSDGVFSIAITLLVIELKIPHLESGAITSGALLEGFQHQWPGYFALVTSFFTILIMWVHHHIVLRLVRRVDVTLLFANGLLLLFVTVVPFTTAGVAEYLITPAAATACGIYAGVFLGIGIGFLALLWASLRPAVLDPKASPATVRRLKNSYWFGPPTYLVAVAVAAFSPWLCMGICSALWIFWAATTREC